MDNFLKAFLRSDHAGEVGAVYIYKGILTNEVLGKVFDLNYKDINLILPGI